MGTSETPRELIIARYEAMSPQLRQAARHVLEHPDEVALVSMRELARRADVQPATMTRLAKFLGFEGYGRIRDHYSEALRHRAEVVPLPWPGAGPAPDGAGPDGFGRDGFGHGGAGPDGAGRDGFGQDGAGQDGGGHPGPGHDGPGAGGPGHDGRDGSGRDSAGRDGGGGGGRADGAEDGADGMPQGARALAQQMLGQLAAQILRLGEGPTMARIEALADRLAGAPRVYVLGLRSCHSVAWHFHYVMSLLGEKTVHVDGPAGTGADALLSAGPEDVLLVVSIHPYMQHVLDLAALAGEQGLGVVTITDSEVSPLVAMSELAVFCQTESRSFFHSLTPALAVSELLCGLIAARDRQEALQGLRRKDAQMRSLGVYSGTARSRRV